VELFTTFLRDSGQHRGPGVGHSAADDNGAATAVLCSLTSGGTFDAEASGET